MKRIATYSTAGPKLAKLSFRVENPPVAMVVIACTSASKNGMSAQV